MKANGKRKPTLLIDFDGVIHRYSKGWHDGSIYDPPTEGFVEWAKEAQTTFRLVVFSTRCATEEGKVAIQEWFLKHKINIDMEFSYEKIPAWAIIDDRALTFDGDWGLFKSFNLRTFRSWSN